MTKPHYTPLLIALDALCILLILLTLGYVAALWPELPERLPTHYNFAGEIDGWGSRASIWLLPGLSLFLYAGMTFSMFFPKYINVPVQLTEENRGRVMHEALLMMGWLKPTMVALFSFITLATARLIPLPVWPMFAFVGLILLIVALFFIRLRKAAKPAEHHYGIS